MTTGCGITLRCAEYQQRIAELESERNQWRATADEARSELIAGAELLRDASLALSDLDEARDKINKRDAQLLAVLEILDSFPAKGWGNRVELLRRAATS